MDVDEEHRCLKRSEMKKGVGMGGQSELSGPVPRGYGRGREPRSTNARPGLSARRRAPACAQERNGIGMLAVSNSCLCYSLFLRINRTTKRHPCHKPPLALRGRSDKRAPPRSAGATVGGASINRSTPYSAANVVLLISVIIYPWLAGRA